MKKINFDLLTGLGNVLESTSNIVRPSNIVHTQRHNTRINENKSFISNTQNLNIINSETNINNGDLSVSSSYLENKTFIINEIHNNQTDFSYKNQITENFINQKFSKHFNNDSILGFDKESIIESDFYNHNNDLITIIEKEKILEDKINKTDFLLETAEFTNKNIELITLSKQNNYLNDDHIFDDLIQKSFIYTKLKKEGSSFKEAQNDFQNSKAIILSKKETLKKEINNILSQNNLDLNDIFRQIKKTHLKHMDQSSAALFLETEFKSNEFSKLQKEINKLKNEINNINYYTKQQGSLILKFQNEIHEQLAIKTLLVLGSITLSILGTFAHVVPAAGTAVSIISYSGSFLVSTLINEIDKKINLLTNQRNFLIENNKLLLNFDANSKKYFYYLYWCNK